MKLSHFGEKQKVQAIVFSSETDLVLNPQVVIYNYILLIS